MTLDSAGKPRLAPDAAEGSPFPPSNIIPFPPLSGTPFLEAPALRRTSRLLPDENPQLPGVGDNTSFHMLPFNTTQPRIIGICGQRRHGKDSLAGLIQKLDPRFRITHFADPLKSMAASIFDIHPEWFVDAALKEKLFPGPLPLDEYVPNMRRVTGLEGIKEHDLSAYTPRQILQFFGTDYVRDAQNDFWVDATMARLGTGDYLIPDVRFQNEADVIRSIGGFLVRIIREGFEEVPEHVSEQQGFKADVTLNVHDGDFAKLEEFARHLLVIASARVN